MVAIMKLLAMTAGHRITFGVQRGSAHGPGSALACGQSFCGVRDPILGSRSGPIGRFAILPCMIAVLRIACRRRESRLPLMGTQLQ